MITVGPKYSFTWIDCDCVKNGLTATVGVPRSSRCQLVLYPFCVTGIVDPVAVADVPCERELSPFTPKWNCSRLASDSTNWYDCDNTVSVVRDCVLINLSEANRQQFYFSLNGP